MKFLAEEYCVDGVDLAVVHELDGILCVLVIAEYFRVEQRSNPERGGEGGGEDAGVETQADVIAHDLDEAQVVLETELGIDCHGLLHRGAVTEDAAAVAVPFGSEGYLLVEVYLLVVEIGRLSVRKIVGGQGRGVVPLAVVEVDGVDV